MRERFLKTILLVTKIFIAFTAMMTLVAAATGWLWLAIIPIGVLIGGVVLMLGLGVFWGFDLLHGICASRIMGMCSHLFVHRPRDVKSFTSLEDELQTFNKE